MGGCMTSVPKEPEETKEDLYDKPSSGRPSNSLKALKTTRTDLAKFYLKFPKINKAYKHLFKGWCEEVGKSVKEGCSAANIFNLEGPCDKASDALSRAGISMTTAEILTALDNENASPRPAKDTLRFKDLILAICWNLKDGLDNIKRSSDDVKYDEILNGFKIVRDMFAQIDVDGSGEISLSEFKEAFSDLSHGDDDSIAEKRMAELDFNDDKEISYPEFCIGLSVWVGFVDDFE